MDTLSCSLVPLTRLSDPLLLPWLDLYETAFPPNERVLVSRILSAVRTIEAGQAEGRCLLAAVDLSGQLIGLAYTYEPPDLPAAFLWYFAVDARLRGQGIGGCIYQALLARLRPGTRVLLFDVEDPRQTEPIERTMLARRRIGFYRRQGARLIGGIRYLQRIGEHLPPIELRLMAHPLAEMEARAAVDLAQPVWGEAITVLGEPFWEPDEAD